MFSEMYADPKDAKEFERRVAEYLSQVRAGLLDHLVRTVVESDKNKVYFTVGNETDDSVTGVQLTVVLDEFSIVGQREHLQHFATGRMTARRDPLPTRRARSTRIGGASRRRSAIALRCKGGPGVRHDEAMNLRRVDPARGPDLDPSQLAGIEEPVDRRARDT